MNVTWQSPEPPDPVRMDAAGWLRVLARGIPLALLVFGGLAVLLLVRLAERPLCGLNRPVTPFITQFVCRIAFRILGMKFTSRGALMHQRGAVVANHTSWLDIFALNARKRIYFVSKAEVAAWPGIGWLARATGTLFIERDPRRSRNQLALLEARLQAGHKLLIFPEGTSTDGLRVLPFKTTLFAAFYGPALQADMHVQPVAVIYHAPPGAPARYYGWWGDMAFGPDLLKILATRPQGHVELVYLPPLRIADFADRKTLARAAETAIRTAHEAARALPSGAGNASSGTGLR